MKGFSNSRINRAGIGLFILLVSLSGAGISRSRMQSRRAAVTEIRKNLAQQAARVDLHLQSSGANPRQIESVLEQVRRESGNRIAWMQVRDANGYVRGHAGTHAAATFPLEFVRSQLRKRRPVFAVVQTQAGPVLLEVFPVWLPAATRDPKIITVAGGDELFGVIEIAARLTGGVSRSVISTQAPTVAYRA